MTGFSVIYADCPWSFDDDLGGRGAPYERLDTTTLCSLPVHLLAAPDALLFTWATGAMLPEALASIAGWGFEYVTVAFDWLKETSRGNHHFGMGRWTRAAHEWCLLARRGDPRRISASVRQTLLTGTWSRPHNTEVVHAPVTAPSAKPPFVRDRIVELCGDVPRVELFARPPVPTSWQATGLEYDGRDIRDVLRAAARLRAA